MPSANDNWCPEVFRSIFVDRHNDDDIVVSPCCQADGRREKVVGFNFYTSEFLQELRQQFKQGHRPQECRRCWESESLGHKSRRQSAVEFFQDVEHGDDTVKFESLDHSVTWACNLACVMCGPYSSSTWAKELSLDRTRLREMGRLFNKNDFLDHMDVSDLRKIHFNGGEPLINDDQFSLLKRVQDQGSLPDLFISYNTNGTVMPDQRVIDLWQQCRLVKIFFSIDAVGPAFDYVRYPASWEQVQTNMLEMRQNLPSNVMFGFNVTVGSYNLLEIPDVWRWFDTHLRTNREGDGSDFNWQLAYRFDFKYLPQHVKKLALKILPDTPELSGMKTYLQDNIDHERSDQWIEALAKIDHRRGTDWTRDLKIAKHL